jgi:FAD synthase
MNATVTHPLPNTPALAVIGTWEPLLTHHQALFRELAEEARRRGRASVAMLIDPIPAMAMYGPSQWPVFDDLASRVRLAAACGIDGIVRLDFARADFKAGAAEFFGLVGEILDLEELWLGATQNLGTGPAGGNDAVLAEAARAGVRVRRLPKPPGEPGRTARTVQHLLTDGRLIEAATLVGRRPVWSFTGARVVETAWLPGDYCVAPCDGEGRRIGTSVLRVRITDAGEQYRDFTWPSADVAHVAFLSGPGDTDGSCWRRGGGH